MDNQVIYTGPVQQPKRPPARRRKRGVKACVNCVAGKRRCEGGSPCSNCYHAHKKCIYTDKDGHIVPAPPRNQTTHSAAASESTSYAEPETPTTPIRHVPRRRKHTRLDDWGTKIQTQAVRIPVQSSVIFQQRLGIDPVLARDLIELFFVRCFPHKIMIHRPTFLADFAAGRVPSFLTKAVLALATPFSDDPALHPKPDSSNPYSPRSLPRWQTGSPFADSAFEELFDPVSGRVRYAQHQGLELEIAQACCLLSYHATCSRVGTPQSYQQEALLQEALALLTRVGVPDWDVIDVTGRKPMEMDPSYSPQGLLSRALWRRRECFRRTLWVVHALNLIGCAMQLKDMRFRSVDVKIFLPVNDALFDLDLDATSYSEGCSSATIATSPPSSIHSNVRMAGRFIAGSDEDSESSRPSSSTSSRVTNRLLPGHMYVSEFGYFLKVEVIYAKCMAALGRIGEWLVHRRREDERPERGPDGETMEDIYQDCLVSLRRWELSLPPRLQLSDSTLDNHARKLNSGTPNDSWSWALAHAMAQCCILVLHEMIQEIDPHSITQSHVQQRDSAYNNIVGILERMGPAGRSSPSVGVPLWHLGPPLLHETPTMVDTTLNSNPRIKAFFDEYEANWGIPARLLCSLEFRRAWTAPLPDATPFTQNYDPDAPFLPAVEPRGDVTGEQYRYASSTFNNNPPQSSTSSFITPMSITAGYLKHISATVNVSPPRSSSTSEAPERSISPTEDGSGSQVSSSNRSSSIDSNGDRHAITPLPNIANLDHQTRHYDPTPLLTFPPLHHTPSIVGGGSESEQGLEVDDSISSTEGPSRRSQRPPKGMPWLANEIRGARLLG